MFLIYLCNICCHLFLMLISFFSVTHTFPKGMKKGHPYCPCPILSRNAIESSNCVIQTKEQTSNNVVFFAASDHVVEHRCVAQGPPYRARGGGRDGWHIEHSETRFHPPQVKNKRGCAISVRKRGGNAGTQHFPSEGGAPGAGGGAGRGGGAARTWWGEIERGPRAHGRKQL